LRPARSSRAPAVASPVTASTSPRAQSAVARYPREIEEFLYAHPNIVDVQVIGVPDERYGEEIMAWVTLRDGTSLTVDDVREFCAGKIVRYKVPRYAHVTDVFPMTVTGKIQKFKMREMAVELLGLQNASAVVTA
jgi:fatty-acyl-CoA synthase